MAIYCNSRIFLARFENIMHVSKKTKNNIRLKLHIEGLVLKTTHNVLVNTKTTG
jgi:hypothetical protein